MASNLVNCLAVMTILPTWFVLKASAVHNYLERPLINMSISDIQSTLNRLPDQYLVTFNQHLDRHPIDAKSTVC